MARFTNSSVASILAQCLHALAGMTQAGTSKARMAQQAGAIALGRLSDASWGLAACEAAMALRNDGMPESTWAGLGEAGLALYTTEACSDTAAA